MKDQIKILGILNIVMGCLTALAGVVVLLAMGSIAGFIAVAISSGNSGDYGESAVAAPVIATIGLVIAIFFFVLALPAIIGGWGLINYRPWSRILMIVVSIFHLFHIPLGTALGIYGLIVLLNPESQRVLESGGVYLGGSYGIPGAISPPAANLRPPSAPGI